MTWDELAEMISEMTHEQAHTDVTISLGDDEFIGVSELAINEGDDVLDDGHPYLTLIGGATYVPAGCGVPSESDDEKEFRRIFSKLRQKIDELESELKADVVNVTYVSNWDSYQEIRTKARYNPQTHEVTDIEHVDVEGLDLHMLNCEWIELDDGTIMYVCDECDDPSYALVDGFCPKCTRKLY